MIVNNLWYLFLDFSHSFINFIEEILQIELNVTKKKVNKSNEFFLHF